MPLIRIESVSFPRVLWSRNDLQVVMYVQPAHALPSKRDIQLSEI